jgi:hypothetical protein
LDLAQVDKVVEKESTAEQLQAFAALMMWAWFNRRWVIQKLISAEDVTLYCVEIFSIGWKGFCDGVALFGAELDAVRELFRLSPSYVQHGSQFGTMKDWL